MHTVLEVLEQIQTRAKKDDAFRQALIATKEAARPIQTFCRLCNQEGYDISAMDLVSAGEEAYAAMRRSTNGGGENSPLLEGEDDLYEMLMAALQ